MKIRLMNLVFTGLVAGSMLASPAFAQTPDSGNIPDHPRVNEVDQRLTDQQNRVNQGVENGTITGKQATNDEKRDARVQRQATRDESKHGGHLTKREQRRLNRELNKNSKDIHKQKAN